MLDADEIIPGLWQGSAPPRGSVVADAGFNVLVLCARGDQRRAHEFPGVAKIIHAPNEDHPRTPMTRDQLECARRAALAVAIHLRDGDKVLVTCIAGVNRSALVVALAIHAHLGCAGRTCIDIVREMRRPDTLPNTFVLSNTYFVHALEQLPAGGASST